MKKSIFFIALLALAACGGNKPVENGNETSQDSVAVKDTTTYGKALDQGMSVFIIKTNAGDTIEALKDDEVDGKQITGTVYGGILEADSFAVTYQKGSDPNMPVLGTAINLTKVENIVGKDYSVFNGQLIVKGDTVDIIDLTETSLKVKSHKDGKEQEFKK